MKVRLRISTWGRPAKRYGATARKIGAGGVEEMLLSRIGWQMIKKSYVGYSYMLPPPGGDTKHPEVEVEIPEEDEIMKLAAELHAQGKKYRGKWGDWSVEYDPVTTEPAHKVEIVTAGLTLERHWEERPESTTPAHFRIGESIVWSVRVFFENPLRVVTSDEHIVRCNAG